MRILAIETSGKTAAIALGNGRDAPLERRLSDSGRRHAQTLVYEIDTLLNEQGKRLSSEDLIAVSIGPGSFTGLRVGVVCAKTLAYATGCRLTGVDTFECIALNSPSSIERLYVVADAQRGGLFAAEYVRQDANAWKRRGRIQLTGAEIWASSRVVGDVVCGAGIVRIRHLLPDAVTVLNENCWTPTAASVVTIGLREAEAERLADCFTLEPFYLRPSAAEEKAEQAARVSD